MLRGVWGDDKRFRDTYFKSGDLKGGNGEGKGKGGVYVTGDRARRDHQGQYWITGRADDVMVVSGHNIGTAEVESAAVCHPLIGEAAVVGVPHELKGTSMCLFVSPGQPPNRDDVSFFSRCGCCWIQRHGRALCRSQSSRSVRPPKPFPPLVLLTNVFTSFFFLNSN